MEIVKQEQQNESVSLYQNASMLKIEMQEQEKLLASFDSSEIEIRPDGIIYLPQVFWRKRLNDTFGIGQWCLIIKNQTKDPNINKLYVEGVLMIRGAYVSTAVGEAEYIESNANMSWASVWESAKSDCITRCCKDLGIASELWQPAFISEWIEANAVKVWVEGKNKPQWRKKDAKPFFKESGPVGNAPSQPKRSAAPEPIVHYEADKAPKSSMQAQGKKEWLNPNTETWAKAVEYLKGGGNIQSIEAKYRLTIANREMLLMDAV